MTVTRKMHTGEPGNAGQFGSKSLNEPSSLTLESADEPEVIEESVTRHYAVQTRVDRVAGEPESWKTIAIHDDRESAFRDLRWRKKARVQPMIRTEQILDERVTDPAPSIRRKLSAAGQWDAFRKFARDGHGMTESEVRQTFDIGAVIAENTDADDWGNITVRKSTQDIMASLEAHRWDWAETDEDLCHDRGPRIGGHEDTPRCRLVKDHQSKSHTTHPENDGWDHTW